MNAKVFLIGYLARDCEYSKPKNVELTKFTVAVNRSYKDNEGNKIVDFFNVVCWRKLAEITQSLTKGQRVAVSGTLQTRSYEVNGERRTATDIMAEEIEFLTPKGESRDTPPPAKAKATQMEIVEDEDLPF